jgi:hypothetical protein
MRYICNMELHMKKLADLAEYEFNARTHSEAEIDELVGLIREFGWTQPILFDSRGIVAGHRRKAAAARIYAGGEVIRWPNGEQLPVGCVPGVDVSGWTPAQRQAAILADNKSALNGGWDLEMLKKELDEIGKMDFDLSKTGFSNAEIDALLTGAFEDLPVYNTTTQTGTDIPDYTPETDSEEPHNHEPGLPGEEEVSLKLRFPESMYYRVKNALAEIDTTPEQAIIELLQL